MRQKDYWNSVSEQKKFTTPFHAAEFEKFVDKNAVVLDVGCGYGRTLNELHQLGYQKLMGIDFSEGMISRGKKLFPCLDLRVKENPSIDLPDGRVDAVILFAVLTCIHSNEEQRALLAEIRRVLKPGGILYVNDFLLNTDQRNRDRYRKFEKQYECYGVFELPEGAVLRHHSREWIRELLADFEPLSFSPLTFTTMNGHSSNGFCCFGRR